MPSGARAVRWAALFSSPFFHPTVMVDRQVLDAHGLRYDTSFAESEDYDLWSRLLAVADGDNLRDPLVLYRRHPAQASTRRADIQRACQRRVALGQIAELVPGMGEERAELAWLVGSGRELPPGSAAAAADALGELVDAFERRHGGSEARRSAAWALASARGDDRASLTRAALSFDRLLPLQAASRWSRRRSSRAERDAAATWLRHGLGAAPVPVAFVLPEPTPYRNPMLDLLAAREEIDLTAIYAGGSVQRREWELESEPPVGRSRGAAHPGRPSRPPARLPAHARRLRRPAGRPAGCRRRVRVEHVRVTGSDRVVPRCAACPTCCSSSRTTGTSAPAGGAP